MVVFKQIFMLTEVQIHLILLILMILLAISITSVVTNITANEANDGSISVSAFGGTSPLFI